MKRIISLFLVAVLVCSMALGEASLPEPENGTTNMLLGESAEEYAYEATLYYIGTDGITLSQSTRTLLIGHEDTLPTTVLAALFNPSESSAQASVAPGDTHPITCELTNGIATVDLSIEARNVQSNQQFLMMYFAIAGTLLELEGVYGVNILINRRHEGVLRLPVGILTDFNENPAAAWAQTQADAERYFGISAGSVTRTAAIYYPSVDGMYFVPESQELTFSETELSIALLTALSSNPKDLTCAVRTLYSGRDSLAGEPVIVVTNSGERVLEMNLSLSAINEAAAMGLTPWQVYGSIVLTLCSFIPELDAIRLSIDAEPVEQAQRANGETFIFEDTLLRRRDFSGFIGSAAKIYLADADGALKRYEYAMPPGSALSPGALLESVFSEEVASLLDANKPLPEVLDATDILGIYIQDGIATLNLSAEFYSACQTLNQEEERTAIYSIVNTLCSLSKINGVRFLIEGNTVETLTDLIYLKTVLLPSPGIDDARG